MAIASYDSIIAAAVAGKLQEIHFNKTLLVTPVAGGCVSLWESNSTPPAGTSGTSLVARACTPSVTGAMFFQNPTGSDNLYLINALAYPSAANIGSLIVYDRIADISGISLTTLSTQNITMGSLPRYADGQGVQMFLEVTTTISGGPVFSIAYTDQSGNAGTTASITGGANAVGRFVYNTGPWIPLADGDTGVRAVTSFTCSATAASGIARLVLAKQLCVVPLLAAGAVVERDLVTQTPKLPRLYNDHCLGLIVIGSAGGAGTVYGSLSAVAG